MQHICETCLLIAEADSFLSSYYLLTFFLHWMYKMKYSRYQDSFVILGWLVYWFEVGNAPLDKKKSEIIVFKNKLLLVSLLCLAGCVRRLKSLKWFWPYVKVFRVASRPVNLSNCIAFDVCLFVFFWFHKVWHCFILRTFVRFETMIWPSTDLKVNNFRPRVKRQRSEE